MKRNDTAPPSNGTSPGVIYYDWQNVLNGTLVINGTHLESITLFNQDYITEVIAPNVETISGFFNIWTAPRLKRLWFPKLKEVKGIAIRDAPALSELSGNFYRGNAITLTSTSDEDYSFFEKLVILNTGIKALSLNSVAGVGDGDGDIKLIENPYLERLTLTGLVRAPREIEITYNGDKLKTRPQISFPDLEYSSHIEIAYVSELNLPQLRNSTGTLSVRLSTMKYLEYPSLVNGGAVTFSINPNLERVELPNFETTIYYAREDGSGWVLGFWDNPKLISWTAPPKYRTSPKGGATTLWGNFKR